MSEQNVPVRIYLMIFVALMLGTALTVVDAYFNLLCQFYAIVDMTIAVGKATLVVFYFMHVRYSTRLIWVIVASAMFWMALLFSFTLADYFSRDWLSIGY